MHVGKNKERNKNRQSSKMVINSKAVTINNDNKNSQDSRPGYFNQDNNIRRNGLNVAQIRSQKAKNEVFCLIYIT